MTAQYTYLSCDLATNEVLAELPLRGVSFTLALNRAGDFSATLPLGDSRVTDLDPISATEPIRTALYVDRGGVLLWGGIVWTRRYNSATRSIELAGNEFWSYFRKRRITDTLAYTNEDQLTIVRELIDYAQAKPGGDIGVDTGSGTSGVVRDRTYSSYEYKPVGEAVEQLSAVLDGFDFAIDVAYSAGEPAKFLRLGYPRRGRTATATGLLFELDSLGGNILGYSYPEDGTSSANTVHSIGAGDGESILRSVSSRTDLIDAGFPLIEELTTYKDVVVQSTLDAHAEADVEAFAGPVTIAEVTVQADTDPMIGSYIVGDEARFRINDERFADDPLDTYHRIVAMTVRPGDDEQETVTLTLNEVA